MLNKKKFYTGLEKKRSFIRDSFIHFHSVSNYPWRFALFKFNFVILIIQVTPNLGHHIHESSSSSLSTPVSQQQNANVGPYILYLSTCGFKLTAKPDARNLILNTCACTSYNYSTTL